MNSLQQQAITLLTDLGYRALDPEKVTVFTHGRTNGPLLKDILKSQLQRINRIAFQGQEYSFSDKNIAAFVTELEKLAEDGSPYAAKQLLDLLLLGKSFEETIEVYKKSYTLKLIDWENMDNNQYDLVNEFSYPSQEEGPISDIVLFINGIPLVVIECSDYSAKNAIHHHIRNQRSPKKPSPLYQFAQLLIAAHPEGSKYGTPDSPEDHWAIWKEDLKHDPDFWRLFPSIDRLPHAADRILYALCRPARLLELISRFILSGEKGRRIARYYQYFAVRQTLEKIGSSDAEGKRIGGHLRHLTGSGKLNTLFLLIRNIFLSRTCGRPRMIILSDRTMLDQQVVYQFKSYGQSIEMPATGRQLLNALRDENTPIIATVWQKISAVVKMEEYRNTSSDLFIFIEELDRMHDGALYDSLRKMFPNACYIGFSGMAMLKGSISADLALKDLLHSYTFSEAVQDGIFLPVSYEKKSIPLLNPAMEETFDPSSAIAAIASDITAHYNSKWKATHAKAMLVVPSIKVAEKFQQYFEDATAPRLKAKTLTIDQDYEEFELLIVVDKIFSGLDTGRLDILYIVRNMNPNQLLQVIGKVARPAQGKAAGVVIDYVGILDRLKQVLESDADAEFYSTDSFKAPITTILDKTATVKKAYADLSQQFSDVPNKYTLDNLPSAVDSPDKRDHFFELFDGFNRAITVAFDTDAWRKMFAQYEVDFYRNKLISYQQYAQQLREIVDQNLDKAKEKEGKDPFFTTFRHLLSDRKIDLPIEIVEEYSWKILSVLEKEMIPDWASNKIIYMQLQNGWDDVLIEMKKRFSLELSYNEFDTFLSAFLSIAKERY